MSDATKREPIVFTADEGIWLHWLGHPVRYLAIGEATGGFYCASVGIAYEGQGAPPHRHSFDEGFYVLSGEVQFTAGNKQVTLGPGEFIQIGSNTAHFPRVISDQAELLTIATPSGFDRFQREAGELTSGPNSPSTVPVSEMQAAIKRIAPEYEIDMNPPADAFEKEPEIHISRRTDGDVVDAVGDRYRFLVEGEQTSGRYALWHATISSGGGPPLHTHAREEEMFYVLSGNLTFEANGDSFTGGPGTFVNLPIGSRHRFSNQTTEPAEVLILVAPAGLEKMFRRTGAVVSDPLTAIAPPSNAEKKRLVEIAADYGIELHLPH